MKRLTLYILALLSSVCSCSDYLDRHPLNAPSDGTFLTSETEMQMALTGCYTALWSNFNGIAFPLIFDYCSDIGYERGMNALQVIAQGAADADNEVARQYWKTFYQGIAKCNYLLQNMERGKAAVPPGTYARIEAEARFLRALYYSYLIELYGDVPLVTEVLNIKNARLPRTPKSRIADFLLTELTEAAAVLPATNTPLSGHATKGAALAIKARVALYNERWEDAIHASLEVMKMERREYKLEDDYSSLFTYGGQTSKEIIFSIQYLKGTRTHALYRVLASRNANGQSNKIPSYQLADSWECTDGRNIDESPLYDPQKPFANRDPRLGYSLAVPGSEYLGFQFETHGDSVKCWNYTTHKRVDNQEATHAYATFSGLCWRKYANIEDKAAIGDCEGNIILIRYAEVLLTYAEAKIKAGSIDPSVLDAINAVRQRPSVDMPPITTTDPDELFFAVARERKYELAGEGLRLFDIRRWKIAEQVMNQPLLGRMKKKYPDRAPAIDKYGTADYTGIPIAQQGEPSDFKMRIVDKRMFDKDRDYLWPVPLIERKTNPALQQNPGYE